MTAGGHNKKIKIIFKIESFRHLSTNTRSLGPWSRFEIDLRELERGSVQELNGFQVLGYIT